MLVTSAPNLRQAGEARRPAEKAHCATDADQVQIGQKDSNPAVRPASLPPEKPSKAATFFNKHRAPILAGITVGIGAAVAGAMGGTPGAVTGALCGVAVGGTIARGILRSIENDGLFQNSGLLFGSFI